MLAIWSLVPLPFLNAACTSGNSLFKYCWSLTCRILSLTLLACEMSAIVHGLNIFWHYLSLRLKGKLAFSSSVTTAEISKNASILSAALKQCYLLGFEEISSLSHSVFFSFSLHFFISEGFLISSYCSLELCIQLGISFLFSFAFHFSSFPQLFVRLPQTTILPFCSSFSWGWFWSPTPVQC